MNLKKISKDEKGSFIIEAVLSFMLFIIIFMAVFEVFLMVEKKLYVEKLSREIGYEAAITSVDEANDIKGLFAHQYFSEEEIPYLFIEDLNRYSSDDHIHCYVAYYHRPFKYIFPSAENEGRKLISATSIFPRQTPFK